MQSQTKRRLPPGELDALLRASSGIGCRLESELTDGWFNTAYRVVLDDGRPAVVKLAPPTDVAVLRYERGIMATEAMVYRRIAALPGDWVPTPALLHAGEEFLAVAVLEGTPWDKAADRLPPAAQSALRRELGAIIARLHTLAPEDGRFGYPAAESALSASDWRTAFTAMVDALLDDAERWQSPLGVPPAEIRTLVAEGGYALDEVTEPRLVHFDLWPGNIFVDVSDNGAPPRIAGLIDHERAFWGDPAAELVSLAFGGDTGPDSDLVAGYTEVGGDLDFTPAFRHRLALYRLYLSLLLVVECGPRGYGADHLASCSHTLTDTITQLRALE
ncbi:aminoglycoside phosphotransferase family protein [Streptomyces sp. ISL-22]|uniref:phosphotransferase family protein n=1 Tax=unclassified Streptomyces TaxID=2593676 RepID=UPI001BEC8838|nr:MULTISPECIES: aminoglycoside phosphotransferase family protein [unclassified Streptomyces]MBT2420700.1 aminoglycoside phosphotransferase family protein [Streptomyces sp. ISL-24]MBT2434835.1 aminoglycoside phosphotransferase family protein [Streptomyces sp. ISL-22]